MALIQTVAPTSEPVSLAEVKQHLNVDFADDDNLLSALLISARHQAENYMKRQIMPATFKYITRDFPCSTCAIELMRPPLSTVSTDVTITYVDNVNATNTVTATAYTVDFERDPGRVYPSFANEWPSNVASDHPKSVQITYKSGYVDKQSVPQPIKLWIMQRVGVLYEYREELTPDSFNALPHDYTMGLLDPFKVIRFTTGYVD
jgi:uncharacterized phiE125 gp8 family phage protein